MRSPIGRRFVLTAPETWLEADTTAGPYQTIRQLRIEGTSMNFSHDNLLSALARPACGLVIMGALGAPPSRASSLSSPQRPAVIAPVNSTAVYKTRSGRNHDAPYLAMIGPAPLSFGSGERALPPEPVLPTPPKSPVVAADSGVKPPGASTERTATSSQVSPEEGGVNATITTTEKPVSILPDDMRREIRPEDVLPFFQFPGAPDGGALIVPPTTAAPRPATAPPSSATYNLQ